MSRIAIAPHAQCLGSAVGPRAAIAARVERWRSYWTAPGGRLSCAFVRIAIACSLSCTIVRMRIHAVDARSTVYYAHGIWHLYPGRPPDALLAALSAIAIVATLAMLAGAWTRLAHVASLVAVLALATHEASGLATWSHQNVPPLLAGIAFLGARGGDALSIDAWRRRRRGLPPLDVPGAYQGAVRLVQLAVASIFFFAAICKLRSAGWTLGWALSDNLRHQLLLRFDWYGRTRTPVASWLLVRSWRYEACALANLVSQLVPMVAVFAIDRPRVRLACGLVWIGELVGLGVVMAYWNLHWLPLAAAFVDWDRLFRVPVRDAPVRRRIGPSRFAAAFLAIYAPQALLYDQRFDLYPLSKFPMFAEIRAKRPFSRHQSYQLVGARVELVGAGVDAQAWVDGEVALRELWRERRAPVLRHALQGILDDVRARFPDTSPIGVRLWLAIDEAPAYPAPPRLAHHDVAIVAELETTGRFRTALGSAAMTVVLTAAPANSLVAYRDDLFAPEPLAASKIAGGFTLAAPLAWDAFVVAELDGARWLVAHPWR
jgi:hypothetical protein